jgi:hypothetical protein
MTIPDITPNPHGELRTALLTLLRAEPGATIDRAVQRVAGSAGVEALPARAELEAAFESLVDDGAVERVANGGYRLVEVDPEAHLRTVVREAVAEERAAEDDARRAETQAAAETSP